MKKSGLLCVSLCAVLIMSSAGCNLTGGIGKTKNKKQDVEEIEELVEEYVDALQAWDYEPLKTITSFDLDHTYSWLKNTIDWQKDGAPGSQENFEYEYCKYVASTIEADYDLDDLLIDDDEADLDIVFSTVRWTDVCWNDYENTESLLSDLTKVRERVEVSDELVIKKVDGEWIIKKSDNLFDLMLFYCNTPDLISSQGTDWTAEWTEEQPEESLRLPDPVTPEQYNRAMEYNVYELYVSEENIEAFEERYFKESCGEYDFDGNGAPEVIYFGWMEDYGAYFQITVYETEADGVYFCYSDIPSECVDPEGNGSLVMYVTDKELVVTYSYVDNETYICETTVFNKILFPDAYYRCEKDLKAGTESYYTNYIKDLDDDDVMSASEYNAALMDYASRAEVIIYSKGYTPGSTVESPKISAAYDEWRTHDEMCDYYESIIE